MILYIDDFDNNNYNNKDNDFINFYNNCIQYSLKYLIKRRKASNL